MSQKRLADSCYVVSFIALNIEYVIRPFRVILLSVGVIAPFLLKHFYLIVLLYSGIRSFVLFS